MQTPGIAPVAAAATSLVFCLASVAIVANAVGSRAGTKARRLGVIAGGLPIYRWARSGERRRSRSIVELASDLR